MSTINLGRVVGYSAYEIAVQEGFVGTEAEWLASLKGAKGDTGATGPQGETGPAGPNGTNGQDGADGTTFTPSVSAEGVISWTNDGGKTNPSPVNIKGPVGATGPQGPAGTYTAGTGITISNDVISATQELPSMTSSDVGKVLKVNSTYDGVEWANDASQTYTGGTGIDVTGNTISVDNTVAMKTDIPATELPSISSGDAGKALVVNTQEDGVEWATVGGGSGSTYKVYESNAEGQLINGADNQAELLGYLQNNDYASLAQTCIKIGSYFYFPCGKEGSTSNNRFTWYCIDNNKGQRYRISNGALAVSTTNALLKNYTAGANITISSGNMISADIPTVESPIYRITLSTFNATVYTAAATAHNAGKLVLLDDDNSNYHNMSLLGIYTDFSQETDGQGNPVPFMAFNKVDAWVNGNTSVYDGRNYQLYASGNVYTSNPYLEYTPQSTGPVLNSFWLGYGDEPNQTTLFGLNDPVDGIVQDNKYSFNINAELSEAINNSTTYGYNIQGNNFGDNGGGQFTWVDETDFHAWVLENGATKMFVAPQGSSQTEVMITIEFDPNWTPVSVPNLTAVSITDGNTPVVNLSGIEQQGFVNGDGDYVWMFENTTVGTPDTTATYTLTVATDGDISGNVSGLTFTQDGGDYWGNSQPWVIQVTPGTDYMTVSYDPDYTPAQ